MKSYPPNLGMLIGVALLSLGAISACNAAQRTALPTPTPEPWSYAPVDRTGLYLRSLADQPVTSVLNYRTEGPWPDEELAAMPGMIRCQLPVGAKWSIAGRRTQAQTGILCATGVATAGRGVVFPADRVGTCAPTCPARRLL